MMEKFEPNKKKYAEQTNAGTCSSCGRYMALVALGQCSRCYSWMKTYGLTADEIQAFITSPTYREGDRPQRKVSLAASVVRRLKVKDTIYTIEVSASTSLDPVEIVKSGKLLAIKRGMEPTVDAAGEVIGGGARRWNYIQAIETNVVSPELLSELAKRTADMEKSDKSADPLLPQLASPYWRTKQIQRDDSVPYYYIDAFVYCDNCNEPIHGRTVLEVNKYGKVAKELPFRPDDENCIQKPGSRRWLHAGCAAKSVATEGKKEEDVPSPSGEEITASKPNMEAESLAKISNLKSENSEFRNIIQDLGSKLDAVIKERNSLQSQIDLDNRQMELLLNDIEMLYGVLINSEGDDSFCRGAATFATLSLLKRYKRK